MTLFSIDSGMEACFPVGGAVGEAWVEQPFWKKCVTMVKDRL